jgi:hypothetical protein
MFKHNIDAHQITMNPYKLIEAILSNYSPPILTCNGTITIINPMKESKSPTAAAATHKLTPINLCNILPSYLPPTNKLLMNFSTLTLSPSSTNSSSNSTDYLPFIFHSLLYSIKKISHLTKAKPTTNINIEKYINFDFQYASIHIRFLSIHLLLLSICFLFLFFLETLAL